MEHSAQQLGDGGRPLGLLAELTYRCPLHCPYCSNPVNRTEGAELGTAEWRCVLRQAAELGVLHAQFSGGEPLLRPDLEDLTATARQSGLYVTLVTSGVGLTADRARHLVAAGLDSVQLSIQSDEAPGADEIAGARAHAAKIAAAGLVRSLSLPLTLNVVLHRFNINRINEIVALAESLGARRLELANAQYYGWAFRNRQALLPSAAQLRRAAITAAEAQRRLRGSMEIVYVLPDYFGDRPKPCMHGWGRRYLTVNPVGEVLPCPTAREIPGMQFENVRQHGLAWIWRESAAFNRFRGTGWMPEPCRSCPEREKDFGGCRCQAALLTGDPANTDPACARSPYREALARIIEPAPADEVAPALWHRTIAGSLQRARHPLTLAAIGITAASRSRKTGRETAHV